MEKYICIHGHFYQPPRENPWLEVVEIEESAHPHHDWNEKITAECYAPNVFSRILNEKERIVKITNNYAKISFDFGPTLLSWLKENATDVYQHIVEADRQSQKIFSGHGSALAQAYNHLIMPLANRQDKYTQIVWGIKDFHCHFKREPEGMWLPETAVDLETLDIMAELGIKFTILAPHQIRRVRKIGERIWKDVNGGQIDTTRTYLLQLASGRKISLFFYNAPISKSVAFERLLESGAAFKDRLLEAFPKNVMEPQLVHIATDGETYGHHHRFGDMALAFALDYIESNKLAKITNYGEFLEKHPPIYEVEIIENTSWSCSHGIERWRKDCGCNTGAHPDWNQAWRAPLREALDWLRDSLIPLYERKTSELFNKDPWEARNAYIEVILNRSAENVNQFLKKHSLHQLSQAEKIIALKLLEMQRHAMLMYTSCGWFFDDISGIEAVQNLRYAARAIQLAEQLSGQPFEAEFVRKLQKAKSNLALSRDGAIIYEKKVKPARVGYGEVGAYYAIGSLFENHSNRKSVYCYSIEQEDFQLLQNENSRLALGKAGIASEITRESAQMIFGFMSLGDYDIQGGIKELEGEQAYQTFKQEITCAFSKNDFQAAARVLEKNFGSNSYRLQSLFPEAKYKIIRLLLNVPLKEAEDVFQQIYKKTSAGSHLLEEAGYPIPEVLKGVATQALSSEIRRQLAEKNPDPESLSALLKEAKSNSIELDWSNLTQLIQQGIERVLAKLQTQPDDLGNLQKVQTLTELSDWFPEPVNLWRSQNIFYGILQESYPELKQKAQRGDPSAIEWVRNFRKLGEKFSVLVAERV
jgi:alpha-amylase/alpha-mannosidase (GH57 family)